MKSFLLTTFLFGALIVAPPGWAEDGDYKQMISEFEKFRSTYQQDLLQEEPEQPETQAGPVKTDSERDELQNRWDRLVKGIFKKESFFYLDEAEQEEMEVLKTNMDKTVSFLSAHPDISSFLKVAFIRNLHLQSVKKKLEAKLESYSQVVQLEDVLGQFSSFVKELDTKVGTAEHQTSIKQSYPFPGALSLKANIAEQEVRIAKEKYEIAIRDTVTHLKETFYEWVYLPQAIRITREHLQLLKELEAVASVHFRTGKGGFNDIIKAQIKSSKLKDDLINLEEEKGVVEAKLVWFLNIASPFPVQPPASQTLDPMNLPAPELLRVAFIHQQELKLLIEEIKKSEMAIELAEKKYYPDLTPGFSYFEDRKGSRVGSVKTSESFTTTPGTQPELWFGENDAYIREARLNYQSLLKNLEDKKEELRFQVKKFFYALDKAERAVRLYEKSLLPLAQKALEVSVAEYKTGKTDFLSLLDAETTLLNFGIDYQKALKNHGQNKARLGQLVGKPLSRIEVKHETPE
jgi:outer membrane protein, heavy metal efflux system